MASAPLAPVIPESMDRPKRIAKRLREVYPQAPLSACQAVTAQLYFHKDWHALEQAVKAAIAVAPFFDDLGDADDIRHARMKEQARLLCETLGNCMWDGNYSAPEPGGFDNAHLRIQKARGRYQRLLAIELVAELLPTARHAPPRMEMDGFTPLSDPEIVRALPQQLAQWWSVNVPAQSIVAESLAKLDVNPNSSISLLRAAGYWSELCMHYASTINAQMVMGVSFLFATRYATLCLYPTKAVDDALVVLDAPGSTDQAREKAKNDLDALFINAASTFLSALARDDLPEVFAGQPDAFIKNGETCLKIFTNPKSRRGTW